jgi:catechol-2,3-dioxygenase
MPHTSIDARTVMGPVSITVSNLGRSREFYTKVIGLSVLTGSENRLTLGTPSGGLLELTENAKRPNVLRAPRAFTTLRSSTPLARNLREHSCGSSIPNGR